MGRIKVRELIKQRKEAAIARAMKGHRGRLRLRAAAESNGVAHNTLYDRIKGIQSQRKAHEMDQTRGEDEENVIVKQIEDMDQRGFPM